MNHSLNYHGIHTEECFFYDMIQIGMIQERGHLAVVFRTLNSQVLDSNP